MNNKSFLLLFVLILQADSAFSSRAVEAGLAALVEGNYAEAYCQWKPAAQRGDTEAQYNIGWLYANGNGMNVDVAEAVQWWSKAASKGHADAQFAVGLAYTTGEGIKQDIDEAIKWFLAAARQGHEDAQEIIIRLSTETGENLVDTHPELLKYEWYGWQGSVSTDRANLRSGASTKDEILGKLSKGQAVRVVARKGEWLMVIIPEEVGIDGNKGWLWDKLVKRD